jgi:hypothetical protein
MRLWPLLALALAAPAVAGAPPIVVAPAGPCAGEEPELRLLLAPSRGLVPPPGAVQHLTASAVDAGAAAPGSELAPPAPSPFAGPDACDNPGSGCLQDRLFEDPDPGTGCGFPGSVCP